MTPRPLRTACAVLLALSAGRSFAINDCAAIGRDLGSFKVVLGEVTAPEGASSEIKRSLAFKLRTSAEALALTERDRKLRVAICPGRSPEDETEFSSAIVEELSRLGVVLEVWGSVVPSPQAPAKREARINFAVVSLLRFDPNRSGFYDVVYPTSEGGTLGLLKDNVELEALANLSAAIRYDREGSADAAARAYCEAQAHLARSAGLADSTRRPRWGALLEYAVDSRAALVAASLQPGAAPSKLKVTGDRGCPK